MKFHKVVIAVLGVTCITACDQGQVEPLQGDLLETLEGTGAGGKADQVAGGEIHQMCVYEALDLAVVIRRHEMSAQPQPFAPGGMSTTRLDAEIWERLDTGEIVMAEVYEDLKEGSPQSTNHGGFYYAKGASYYRHSPFYFRWNGGFEETCRPGPNYSAPICRSNGDRFLNGSLRINDSFLFEDADLLELDAVCESYF